MIRPTKDVTFLNKIDCLYEQANLDEETKLSFLINQLKDHQSLA